jgi:hypothetical protein
VAGERCGAFPDPYSMPAGLAGVLLRTCERGRGHPPPHRAHYEGGAVWEWADPVELEAAAQWIRRTFAPTEVRMRAESSYVPKPSPWWERVPLWLGVMLAGLVGWAHGRWERRRLT